MHDVVTSEGRNLDEKPALERKRFLILTLFLLCTATNGFQWIQYSSVGEQIKSFYNASLPNRTSSLAISMTSTVYMITYLILIMPATYILTHYGLRVAFLLGSLINALGTMLKCIAIAPTLFPLAMSGQAIASVAQIFTLGNPSYLAALWFSERYISTIAAIGVFGNQVGIALGFLIPSEVLGGLETEQQLRDGLRKIMYPLLALETSVFLIALLYFKRRPKTPPSEAQAKILEAMNFSKGAISWSQSLKHLVSDRNFMLLFVSYGSVTGVFYALSTNLYLYYNEYYPDSKKAAGHVGLILVLAGLPGSVLAGIVLDRTRAYKAIALAICTATLVFMIVYTFLLKLSLYGSYFLAFLLGFFMTGYLPVGFEVAAEMTYPISEGLSSALLNVSAQIFGIATTELHLLILEKYRTLPSNIFLCAALTIGCAASLLMRMKLKRSAVNVDYVAARNRSPSELPNAEGYAAPAADCDRTGTDTMEIITDWTKKGLGPRFRASVMRAIPLCFKTSRVKAGGEVEGNCLSEVEAVQQHKRC